MSIDLVGNKETVASELDFPTGMAFGRDGNLHVSNEGFGFGPGEGRDFEDYIALKVRAPSG